MVKKPEKNFSLSENITVESNPLGECKNISSAEGLNDQLKQDVVGVLSQIFDPEIPVNIYELGLIYKIEVNAVNEVYIQMTLTSPHCPVAESLPNDVEQKTRKLRGVKDVSIELTWEPPWSPDLMSEAAKLELGFI